jgi:hypothetical protein
MKHLKRIGIGGAWLAGAFLFCGMASAQSQQQKIQVPSQGLRSYSISRETVVEGKVVEFTAASKVAPLGPHVTVQTGAGMVDVHLGNAQLLAANNFTLSTGDTVRIVGENVAYGSGMQFLARIVQKGNQVLAVRSARGLPLSPMAKLGQRSEGGAL